MTRGEARDDVLRRRLQEDTPNRWSNENLNRLLNLALQETQKRILAIQPEAFKREYRADQVANQEFYEWPAGMWTSKKLATGNPTDGFVRLSPIALIQAESGQAGFVPWDSRYFMLAPKPSDSVVNGIQCVCVPTLTMAVDTEVLPLPLAMHMAVVLYAEIFALGDVGEASAQAKSELEPIFNSMPSFYVIEQGPTYLAPDTGREY